MSQFQKVAGAVAAGIIGLNLLWFGLPLMQTAFNVVVLRMDQSDPNIAKFVQVGNVIFATLGGVVLLVVGWEFIANATSRDPRDL